MTVLGRFCAQYTLNVVRLYTQTRTSFVWNVCQLKHIRNPCRSISLSDIMASGRNETGSSGEKPNTFLYMAYGSNLLKERVHINSPSAKYVGVARLPDYQLIFASSGNYTPDLSKSPWGPGGVATIVESPGGVVWGTVWEIGMEHQPALDRQEAVHINVYMPLEVNVYTEDNRELACRIYKMLNITPTDPTPHYLSVVQEGAKQSGLPNEYIDLLQAIKHNNYQGTAPVMEQIKQQKAKTDRS